MKQKRLKKEIMNDEQELKKRMAKIYNIVNKHKIPRSKLAILSGYTQNYTIRLLRMLVPLNPRNVCQMELALKKYLENFSESIHREL